jgi:hypothetical protein
LQETAIDYHKVKKDVEETAEKAKQRAKEDSAKVAAAAKEASAKAAEKAKEAGEAPVHGNFDGCSQLLVAWLTTAAG